MDVVTPHKTARWIVALVYLVLYGIRAVTANVSQVVYVRESDVGVVLWVLYVVYTEIDKHGAV